MDWGKIGTAILLIMMAIFIWPRARQMMKDSPEGTHSDWTSALIPLAAVIGFVVLLMYLV